MWPPFSVSLFYLHCLHLRELTATYVFVFLITGYFCLKTCQIFFYFRVSRCICWLAISIYSCQCLLSSEILVYYLLNSFPCTSFPASGHPSFHFGSLRSSLHLSDLPLWVLSLGVLLLILQAIIFWCNGVSLLLQIISCLDCFCFVLFFGSGPCPRGLQVISALEERESQKIGAFLALAVGLPIPLHDSGVDSPRKGRLRGCFSASPHKSRLKIWKYGRLNKIWEEVEKSFIATHDTQTRTHTLTCSHAHIHAKYTCTRTHTHVYKYTQTQAHCMYPVSIREKTTGNHIE